MEVKCRTIKTTFHSTGIFMQVCLRNIKITCKRKDMYVATCLKPLQNCLHSLQQNFAEGGYIVTQLYFYLLLPLLLLQCMQYCSSVCWMPNTTSELWVNAVVRTYKKSLLYSILVADNIERHSCQRITWPCTMQIANWRWRFHNWVKNVNIGQFACMSCEAKHMILT